MKINYRTILDIQFETKEYLHLGETKGLDISESDLPVIKLPNDKPLPFIPGSSIKGVIRAEYGRLLRGLSGNDLAKLIGYKKVDTDDTTKKNFLTLDTTKVSEYVLENIRKQGTNVGILDLLFGSEFFASPTVFSDAKLSSKEEREFIRNRTHVSIDVNTDSSKPGAKIDLEAVEPETTFTGKIIYSSLDYGVESPSPVDKAFDIMKGWLSDLELLLGGWKSRGYGLVEVKVIKESKLTPQEIVGGGKT
ncbi:RAMP superfamily CRISPR-associated protein [Candidatus Acidianus copahuensis]|nr:RAMP superfamily CRISPR-associated protein [Candidatus Acidianus copahuensis]